jgi:general secretion pathway protein D
VGSATLNLLLNDDNTQILQDPRIRATDGQKATLTIGSKIPIATGSYQTGAATALVSSLVNTQFQYIDVGVKVEMTPTVHYDQDVTLKVHIEVSSESGTETISGVTEPILSQRIADQVIRLREGEASILGGIQDNEEQQNWTGIPGLSSIPILKYLFGSKDHVVKNDDIVFVLVPHIVRGEQLDQANLRAIDTGEGQSIELRRIAIPAQANSAMVHPATLARPGFGTVPSQSAPQAAMAALDQMRTSQQESMTNPPAVAQPTMPDVPKSTAPSPPPNTGPVSTPPATAPPVPQPSPAAPATAPPTAMFGFNTPAAPVAPGSTVQIPITISGGADVASIPLQFHYDPANLTLINVEGGDFLGRDGQAVAVIHRDDGPGNVTVVTSRPPGAPGVNGAGTVCVLTFQAKAAGQDALTMTRAGVVNSKQQQMPAQGSTASIQVK